MLLTRRGFLKTGLAGVSSFLAMPTVLRASSLEDIRVGHLVPSAELFQYPCRIPTIAAGNICGLQAQPFLRIGGRNSVDMQLAEEITPNADATRWYIYPRGGARWSVRNEPVTLEQLAANIVHWWHDIDSPLGKDLGRFLADVSVDRKNNRIQLDLGKPNYHLHLMLASYQALIMHPDDGWEFDLGTDGTGPMRIESYVADDHVRFLPVEDYWYGREQAHMPVVYIHMENGSDAFAGLNLDMLSIQSVEQIVEAKLQGFQFKSDPLAESFNIHMNCRNGSPLADATARRALKCLLDSMEMLKRVSGDGDVLFGSVADHTHAHQIHMDYPSGWNSSMYDLDKARRLLQGRRLRLRLHYQTGSVWKRTIAETFQEQARRVGVEIELHAISGKEFNTNWGKDPNADLVLDKWGHRPLAMQVFSLAYHSGAVWNPFGWENAEFDRLVDDVHGLPLGAIEMQAKMTKALQIMQDDGPTLTAMWGNCNKAISHKLQMAQVGSTGFFPANRFWKA